MIDEKKLIADIRAAIDDGRYTGYVPEAVLFEVYAIIRDMPKVGDWIPCSERLPDKEGCYLITTDVFPGGDTAIFYYDENQDWSDVLAWRLLPDPWKGETM